MVGQEWRGIDAVEAITSIVASTHLKKVQSIRVSGHLFHFTRLHAQTPASRRGATRRTGLTSDQRTGSPVEHSGSSGAGRVFNQPEFSRSYIPDPVAGGQARARVSADG